MRTHLPARTFLVAVALALAWSAAPARGERIKDDEQANYELRVPDEWNWIDVTPFERHRVVAGADRRLEKLADGAEATGQGGRVLLSVQDVHPKLAADYEEWLYAWQRLEAEAKEKDPVPEELVARIDELRGKMEAALAALVNERDVLALMLERFDKDPAKWPVVAVDARGIDIGRLPAVSVKAEGPCANHAGVVARCEASMHVWVVRKRLYRLVVWLWTTEKDREHVKDQRDEIELSVGVKNAEAIPRKPAPPKEAGGDAEPVADGDAGERKVIRDLAMGFEVVKPKKIKSVEVDRSTPDDRDAAFRFRGESAGSEVIVDCLSYRIASAGSTAFNLKDWMPSIWGQFLRSHPVGAIETYPFPAVSPRRPFLSLPDLEKKKEVKRPAKADETFSMSDLEKLGVLNEVKNGAVHKVKVDDAWRFVAKGNIERVGNDAWVLYVWSTDTRTYVLRFTVRKEGWSLWKAEIQEILESLTLITPP